MIDSLSISQLEYLKKGAESPQGKLPLFDEDGNLHHASLAKACLQKGLIESWFASPMAPNWRFYKITEAGRQALTVIAQ